MTLARPLRRTVARLALPAVGAALAGCAFPPRELHLAPLVSVHRTAGGGREVEALAGILRWKTGPDGTERAIRPVLRNFERGETRGWDFLFPLGLRRRDDEGLYFAFYPLAWWRRQPDAAGETAFDAAAFPVVFGGRTGSGQTWLGVFPIYGLFRGFFTYDEFRWALFPLYVETAKDGGWRTRSVIWPFFAAGAKEGGGTSLRAWPVYGRTRDPEGKSGFALWPIVHWRSKGETRSSFLVAPFFGKARDGDRKTTSVLWPFFGWSTNPRVGSFVVEAPWPLVRIARRAKGGKFRVTRVLPLFAETSSFDARGLGIRSRVFLWPIFWLRREHGDAYRRSSFYALPLLIATSLERDSGARETLTHLWPLFHRETGTGRSSFHGPVLLPLPRLRGLYENWESLLAVVDARREGDRRSVRGLLDLWRVEADAQESRWSIPLLAASRRKADGTREWSFLAGLLRFRSGGEGVNLLAPAFPGPGFE